MTRRILAERIFVPSMLTEKPIGMQLFHGIPEADDSNRGHSGVQGYSDEVMHQASRKFMIEKSGGQRSDNDELGGRFQAVMTSLKNRDGTEVLDNAVLPALTMGAEREYIPRFAQGITGAPAQNQLGTPKIVPLEKHRKGVSGSNADSGIEAILLFWEEDGVGSTVFDLKMSKLLTKDESTTVGGNGASCEWETILTTLVDGSSDNDPNLTSGDNWPCVDGVEMEDGTILVAWSDEDSIRICRIYGLDTSAGFEQVTSITPTGGSQTHHIGVERVGSRIVLVYGYSNTVTNHQVFARYSDDGGMTWSDEVTLYNWGAGAATARVPIDVVKAHDGWVYALWTDDGQDVVSFRTSDGANWYQNTDKLGPPGAGLELLAGSYCGATMCQAAHGQWHLYLLNTADSGDKCRHFHADTTDDPDAPFSANVFVAADTTLPNATDADCSVLAQCARALNYGGFIDVASIIKDDASGDYYSIWVHRFGMWTSRQREVLDEWAVGQNWDDVWTAHAYPSTSDGHPNIAIFTRTLTGASTSGLKDNDGGSLETYAAAGEDMYYSYGLASNSYDSGAQMAFEMKVTAVGDPKVFGVMTSSPSNKEFSFHIAFDYSSGEIRLYDRVGSLQDTFAPENWSIKDWNYYELIILENSLFLLRAPSRSHRSICQMEVTVFGSSLSTTTYTAQSNSLSWGCQESGLTHSGGTAKAEWRSVYVANDDQNFYFTSVLRGRRCALRPVGLLGGEGFMFNGDFHYVGDTWVVETRAIHDGDNILSSSPSLDWREPEQIFGSDSPERVFTIDIGDDTDEENLEVPIHGFALFARNFLDFKVEYLAAAGGSSWATIFDTNAASPDKASLGPLEVGTIHENMITIEDSGGSSDWVSLLPYGVENLFSSDGRKNWFVRFTGTGIAGALNGQTYKIRTIDRAGRIVLYSNVEEAGGLVGDSFEIFSSEFMFCRAPSGTPFFANKVRLTIYSQSRPDVDESMQLGTFLVGRAMDLPMDEWNFTLETRANLLVTEARNGAKQIRLAGPEMSVLTTQYTGVQDRGMGRTTPYNLFRFLGGGRYPLAWIDDDSVLENDGDAGHHAPLIMRMLGPLNQGHKSYVSVSDASSEGINQGAEIRNVMDISGFVFEEVV